MNSERVPVLLAVQPGVFHLALGALLEQASFDVIDWLAGAESVNAAQYSKAPAIAVLDAAFGSAKALQLAQELQNCFPGLPMLLLADAGGDPDVVEPLGAVLRGYVLKTQPGGELIEAIETVMRGGTYILPEGLVPKDLGVNISAHDWQLLKVIAEGKNMIEASALLGIAHGELLFRRRQLKTTLGVRNTAGLVRYAIRNRIVTP